MDYQPTYENSRISNDTLIKAAESVKLRPYHFINDWKLTINISKSLNQLIFYILYNKFASKPSFKFRLDGFSFQHILRFNVKIYQCLKRSIMINYKVMLTILLSKASNNLFIQPNYNCQAHLYFQNQMN